MTAVPSSLRSFRRWTALRGAILVALITLGLANLGAAPLQRSLGEGLVYFRSPHLPTDLPPEQTRKAACVLDLRYATGDVAAAEVLQAWLRFHSSVNSPVFVLVNGSTAPALQAALAERSLIPGLLTIGLASQRIAPDLTINDTTDNERLAYDALEKGTTIATLTTDHPDKQRNDEASLAHDRGAEPSADPAAGAGRAKAPAPVIDSALQRAIQIHRALVALKVVPKPASPAAK